MKRFDRIRKPQISRRGLLQSTAAVAAGGLLASAVDLSAPAAAHASGEPVLLYDRQAWGARPPTSPIEIIDAPDTIVVHHAVWPNTNDFSEKHAFQVSREIQDLHMDDNGWIDAGQQLTISRGGHVMEGRDRSFEAIRDGKLAYGTQVGNHNGHTIGIENEGTYTEAGTVVPTSQFGSLVQTCAWLCTQYNLDPFAAIKGHRDFNDTICPGQALYDRLPELRQRTADMLSYA
ncbi:MAG TPA: peptidoglycan recognition protein family protein [Candidatus Stackebrandtia faecavium]|nr:peptidoglycan recognition protein family protein [Candidatus Stackebrandtia faecavium]